MLCQIGDNRTPQADSIHTGTIKYERYLHEEITEISYFLRFFIKKELDNRHINNRSMEDAKSLEVFGLSRRDAAFAHAPMLHERVTTIYETHREKIYGFLVGQGLDPAKSQELAQEVFLRFFLALQKAVKSSRSRRGSIEWHRTLP